MDARARFETERGEIREHIKLENDLIHQRMSWYSTFQGLLFGAVAFAWDKAGAQPIVLVACVTGVLVSISIGYAVHRANKGIDIATATWDRIKPKDYKGLDSEGVRSASGIAWLMPGRFVPPLFACMWMIVMTAALFHDWITR